MGEQVAGARVAAAASAAAFVVLDGAALFLPGAPPRARQSAEEIAATLAGHRGRLLASVYVGGLALLALIAFVVTLRRRPARDPGLVTAALGLLTSQLESSDRIAPGQVTRVVQPGYALDGKVLRFAKVCVAPDGA